MRELEFLTINYYAPHWIHTFRQLGQGSLQTFTHQKFQSNTNQLKTISFGSLIPDSKHQEASRQHTRYTAIIL